MNRPRTLWVTIVVPPLAFCVAWACNGQLGAAHGGTSDSAAGADAPDEANAGDGRDAGGIESADVGTSDSGGGADTLVEADAGDEGDARVVESVDAPDDGDGHTLPSVSKIPSRHRASASVCTQARPPGRSCAESPCLGSPFGIYSGGNCGADQDCTTGSNGRCNCFTVAAGESNACSYDQCASDSDCSGGVCVCREDSIRNTAGACQATQTICLPGNCHIDSDCGDAGYCSPSTFPGCGPVWWYGYFCHTASDDCVDDSDCNEAGAYCAFSTASGHWSCSAGACIDS
jgi:hypothetical protein